MSVDYRVQLREGLESHLRLHLQRLLGAMDRDPDSPTYGCFDRGFWHYKAQDWSSAIL